MPRRSVPKSRPHDRKTSASLAWALAVFLLAGCTGGELARTGGGIARAEASQVSAVVARIRAQFPLPATAAIPFSPRPEPEGTADAELPLVLRGNGKGISPGIQVGESPTLRLSLYLAKPGYDSGYATVTPADRPEETWRIVAFDQRGRAGGNFEFLYALSTGEGSLRYLAIVGGVFEKGGEEFLACEGVVILPGEGGRIETWQRAFQLDFGGEFPVVPAYRKRVAEAVRKFKRLEAMEGRRGRRENRLETIAVKMKKLGPLVEGEEQKIAKQRATLQSEREKLRAEQGAELAEAETEMIRYFELRGVIAGEYARFIGSNHYTWRERSAQQDFYDHWKAVELHHPRIDRLAEQLKARLAGPENLKEARRAAMAEVRRTNNWDTDPSRASSP